MNGITQFDIVFSVISAEVGAIQISAYREFNAAYALNENGQTPDCSGKFESSTGLYTDIIETTLPVYLFNNPVDVTKTYEVSFELTDSTILYLRCEVTRAGSAMKHWAPYIFVFFSMLGMSSLSYSQIPTVEREALIALYNSTNGANWTNNSDWLGSAGTECDWYGIDCSGGKVHQFYFGIIIFQELFHLNFVI